MFPNFGGDLVIRHIVHGFNVYDALLKPTLLQTFYKFILGIAGAKDLDQLCITNMSEDVIKVSITLRVKSLAANILRCLQSILS